MAKMSNDDIDLLSLLKIAWNDKWKVIFCIFFCIAVSLTYISFTPSLFKATTIFVKNKNEFYYKFKFVNDILNLGDDRLFMEEPSFLIDNKRIFEMLINEFNDYDEIISTLSENDHVKNKMKSLDDKEKRVFLIQLAKNFTISPENEGEALKVSFSWHDINEGSLLFNKALKVTIFNVKKTLLKQINNITKTIDFKNKREIAVLNTELRAGRTIQKLSTAKKIRYLTEQYKIAKALNLENNELKNFTNISQTTNENQFKTRSYDYSDNSYDYPYYLRGFKAINKEIEVIKSRSIEDNDLMIKGYLNIKEKLLMIDDNNRSKELLEAKEFIDKVNVTDWFNFNFELAEIENLRKSYLYVSISFIIGLFLGIFYVLIINGFGQRKNF